MFQKALLFIAIIGITACGSQKINNYEYESANISGDYVGSDLDSIILPYKDSLNKQMNEVIGTASVSLEKMDPESSLSNFVSDAIYDAGASYMKEKGFDKEKIKNSFCLLNFGGLRSPINEGDITVGNVFELMPFDNRITIVQLSHEKVKDLCRYVFSVHGQPLSNAVLTLSSNEEWMSIGNEKYNFDGDVFVITSDYLAGGGDKMDFFKEPINLWDTGLLIRDVLIKTIHEKKTLGEYKIEGRIEFVK
jgi:2',3'-cyclic-nucleotide 2'-phosphodiesterase (5'-nucleotidase family)